MKEKIFAIRDEKPVPINDRWDLKEKEQGIVISEKFVDVWRKGSQNLSRIRIEMFLEIAKMIEK